MGFVLQGILSYFSVYQGLTLACWGGILLFFFESILCGVFYFLSFYFVNELHFSVATVGLIISYYGIGAICGGFIGGKLSDKISPRIVTIGSLFFQSAGYLFLANLTNVYVLMATVFLLGMATYGFITSNHVWTLAQCRSDEREKLKAINLLSTASNLGIGLSALLIGSLVFFSFHFILLITSLCLFLLAVFLSLQKTKKRKSILIQQELDKDPGKNVFDFNKA